MSRVWVPMEPVLPRMERVFVKEEPSSDFWRVSLSDSCYCGLNLGR